MLSADTGLTAVVECATALERAEASARVLAARAAGHGGSPRAFAELAAIAPQGLIPTPGRGAAHVARQVARAADVAAGARHLLGPEIVDAVEWAAGMAQRVASTSDALDPTGASRVARRGVATVRGLVASTLDRDARWEAFRLGTHLPRASWVAALTDAAARVGMTMRSGEVWGIAAVITGLPVDVDDVALRLLSDRASVVTAAHALTEAESSLVVLQREGHVGSAALPLAREAQARLRSAASGIDDEQIVAGVDRLLEALAALAGAIDPRVAEPGAPPFPGLRRPALTA